MGVFPNGDPGIVLHLEGQAYVDDSMSKYKLITPLEAPVASREDTVSVVNAADPAAIGRTWRVLDGGQTSTLAVVRTTFLDQNTQSSSSGALRERADRYRGGAGEAGVDAAG